MDVQAIISLIEAVSDSNLTGLKLEEENWKLSLSKNKEEERSIHESAKTVCSLASEEQNIKSMFLETEQPKEKEMDDNREKTEKQDRKNVGSTKTEEPKAAQESADIASDKVVVSPLVGTFYSSSSPEADPFVKVGDRVKKGQVLGIIEAMKLMNEIESEYDGTIEAILAENESVVEYGQPLFRIH